MRSAARAGCLALAGLAILSVVDALDPQRPQDLTRASQTDSNQRLGVIVPAYRGDLDRAVSSLERWPANCSPLAKQNVDLVLYYAEGEEDILAVTAATDKIAQTAGRCFSETRTVYAHLDREVSSRGYFDSWPLNRECCFAPRLFRVDMHNYAPLVIILYSSPQVNWCIRVYPR